MLSASRNQEGLTDREIERCRQTWDFLGGNGCCILDTSEAARPGSRTRFSQTQFVVYLGADVIPGVGMSARSRMSEVACLTHELAHAERFRMGIDRTIDRPDVFLDEAEASLHASFSKSLGFTDRLTLVEDARSQIAEWQAETSAGEVENEN